MNQSVRPEIVEFYTEGMESDRLSRNARGQLEFIRTQELIRRHIDSSRAAKILDIGGGMGVHAQWLADDGHAVTVLDPVALHVENSQNLPGVEAIQGDARSLPFPDNSFDHVLLLGPLYHLQEESDRVQALKEAARVSRGLVCMATINRTAAWSDTFRFNRQNTICPVGLAETREIIRTGHLDLTDRNLFTIAYLAHPSQVTNESEKAGLTVENQFIIEGPLYDHIQLEEIWAVDSVREEILTVLREIESEPSLLGTGSHLMTVAKVAS